MAILWSFYGYLLLLAIFENIVCIFYSQNVYSKIRSRLFLVVYLIIHRIKQINKIFVSSQVS